MQARKQRPVVVDVLVFVLAGAVVVYLAFLVCLALMQRSLMYFPHGPIGPAASFGLPLAETLKLETSDGQWIVAWYQAPKPDHPLFIYLHGNGGTLAVRADLLGELAEDGCGFLAIDYRGYGGSTGSPSEAGFKRDAEAAYAKARALGYGPERIVVIGESIGTGVAIPLAAHRPIHALVLDSPFSSTLDIAAEKYWMFPIRLFMLDTFDSYDEIAKVEAPKLFLHAIDDPVVPLAFDKKLFSRAKQPKTMIEVASGAHMVLDQPQVLAEMRRWLADLPPAHVSSRR